MEWIVGAILVLGLLLYTWQHHPELIVLPILAFAGWVAYWAYRDYQASRAKNDPKRYLPLLTTEEFMERLRISDSIKQFPILLTALRAWYEQWAKMPDEADEDDDETYQLAQAFGRAFWKPDYCLTLIPKAQSALDTFDKQLPSSTKTALFTATFVAQDWDTFFQPLRDLGIRRRYLDPSHFTIPVTLNIPHHTWFEGTWIVAPPGRGKTNLLKHLITKLPEPNATVILMDAKGEMLDAFKHMRDVKNELVYLEPDDEWPLAINPLQVSHSVELLEYVFSALLETPMTPYQSTLFRMVLTLCNAVPNATLETFRHIIQHGPKDYDEYVRTLRPRDQDFFDLEWKERIYAERRPEILARLRTLMTNPALDAIFQSKTTKLDMGKLMDEGKVICINNNYDILGDQGSEMFGRLFIALVWAAARKRTRMPEHLKKPVYFFIDEAHYVIARDKRIATIIEQCRAQKIAMFFAHQTVSQIKDEDTKAALIKSCAIKFASTHFSDLGMDTPKEFPKTFKRGQMGAIVRDTADTAIAVNIPPVDLSTHPKLTPSECQDIVNRSHLYYCYLYEEQTYSQTETQSEDTDANLYWKRTLSPRIALKGGVHDVPVRANDGSPKILKVTIKAGTKHGDKVRLRGYGSPKPNGTRGDIIIEWIVPQRPDRAQTPITFAIGADREERW